MILGGKKDAEGGVLGEAKSVCPEGSNASDGGLNE